MNTPKQVVYIVISTLACLSIIGVCALAGTLFFKNYADPAVLTAFISITSGSIGALGAVLTNTRQPVPDTTTVATPSPPDKPATVTIEPTK